MNKQLHFPFGEVLKKVEQQDRTYKKVFVLGVYASAVHARWVNKDGKQVVSALAVASEPEIFWTGKNAESIISKISIPPSLGKLSIPNNAMMNGPSGITLDNKFLKPLKLNRNDVWLCDLLPESRVNVNQRKVIDNKYNPLVKEFDLTPTNIPDFDKKELDLPQRRTEILQELEESKAETLILLGDLPIKYFLNYYDKRFRKLSSFGINELTYGKEHILEINGNTYKVIALCHPRQANRLGRYSEKWYKLHNQWIKAKQ